VPVGPGHPKKLLDEQVSEWMIQITDAIRIGHRGFRKKKKKAEPQHVPEGFPKQLLRSQVSM
jgi:hypothetical protein